MKNFYCLFLFCAVVAKRLYKKDIIATTNNEKNGPIDTNGNKDTIAVYISDAIQNLPKGNTSITASGFHLIKGEKENNKDNVDIKEFDLDINFYDNLNNKKINNMQYKKFILKNRLQKEKELYEKMLIEDYYIK